jgi:hypothetical protein
MLKQFYCLLIIYFEIQILKRHGSTILNNLIPSIVIGTKLDEAQSVRDVSSLRKSSPIALEFRLDEINLVQKLSIKDIVANN